MKCITRSTTCRTVASATVLLLDRGHPPPVAGTPGAGGRAAEYGNGERSGRRCPLRDDASSYVAVVPLAPVPWVRGYPEEGELTDFGLVNPGEEIDE